MFLFNCNTVSNYLKSPFFFSLKTIFNQAIITNTQKKTDKVVNLIFATISTVLSVPFYLLGGSLHLLTSFYTKKSFHIQKKEKNKVINIAKKIASWNVCLFDGGLCVPFGGLPFAKDRITGIIDTIKQNNPDIIALQEVGIGALEELKKCLKDYDIYHSFGSSSLFFSSGIVVLSKVPLTNVHYQPFSEGIFMKRGFVVFETDSFFCATTHLQPGNNQDIRKKQLNEIRCKLERYQNKPKIIFGDLNWERPVILEGFIDLLVNSSDSTATNRFKNSTIFGKHKDEPENESIDTFLISDMDKDRIKSIALTKVFGKNEEKDLSDHHLISIELQIIA